jgi:hypothetical protein
MPGVRKSYRVLGLFVTVYYIKVLAYEAKLFYGSLFGCISRGKNCFSGLKMAKSKLKQCECPLAAGL